MGETMLNSLFSKKNLVLGAVSPSMSPCRVILLELGARISFAESLSGKSTKEDPADMRLIFFVSSKPLKASFTAFSETKKPGL